MSKIPFFVCTITGIRLSQMFTCKISVEVNNMADKMMSKQIQTCTISCWNLASCCGQPDSCSDKHSTNHQSWNNSEPKFYFIGTGRKSFVQHRRYMNMKHVNFYSTLNKSIFTDLLLENCCQDATGHLRS